MNNTFPVCKNCVYSEIPPVKEPCADCQIHFVYDRSKPHFKSKSKPTNADRIRAMTDEELAELFEMIPHSGNPSTYTIDGFCIDDGLRTKMQWLDWLKQEEET